MKISQFYKKKTVLKLPHDLGPRLSVRFERDFFLTNSGPEFLVMVLTSFVTAQFKDWIDIF